MGALRRIVPTSESQVHGLAQSARSRKHNAHFQSLADLTNDTGCRDSFFRIWGVTIAVGGYFHGHRFQVQAYDRNGHRSYGSFDSVDWHRQFVVHVLGMIKSILTRSSWEILT
jgi:hypothetical protein